MKTNTFRVYCKFGSICALICGLAYICVTICALFSPESIISYIASEEYFKDFQSYQPIFIGLKGLLFIANMSLIGVVITFYTLSREENKPFMAWLSILAIIGFGIGMFQSIQDMTMIPYLAEQYQSSNDIIKETLITIGIANPAWYMVSLGLPGIWFIAISLMALNNTYIPKWLILLGLAWGSGSIITAFAHLIVHILLIKLVTYGALVVAPLWSISEAIYLQRAAKKPPPYLETNE